MTWGSRVLFALLALALLGVFCVVLKPKVGPGAPIPIPIPNPNP